MTRPGASGPQTLQFPLYGRLDHCTANRRRRFAMVVMTLASRFPVRWRALNPPNTTGSAPQLESGTVRHRGGGVLQGDAPHGYTISTIGSRHHHAPLVPADPTLHRTLRADDREQRGQKLCRTCAGGGQPEPSREDGCCTLQ